MSSFTEPLIIKKIGDMTWELYTPFQYHVGSEDSDVVITVPKGFITDFASVPRPFWAIFPPDGRWTAAAIIHDYLYSTQEYTRKYADHVFIEAMQVLGVPIWTRFTMWAAVRSWGWIPWNNHRSKNVLSKQSENDNP